MTKKIETRPLNFRTPYYIDEMIKKFIHEYPMFSKTDICNLALIEFLNRFDLNYNYEGIDLKKISKIFKFNMLREVQKLERKEQMSRDLFVNNVMRNILLYIIYKKPKNTILNLVEKYKKEIPLYATNDEKLKLEMEKFSVQIDENKLNEIKNYIQNNYNFLNDLETSDFEKRDFKLINMKKE